MNDYMIYYGLTLLAFGITFGTQLYIQSTYSKYSQIPNKSGFTGARTANEILYRNGLENLIVTQTNNGALTDHYDPRNLSVTLSQHSYSASSIAAMAVAAHECGHAVQDKERYAFLRLRNSLIPAVNFASYGGYLAIMIGLFSGISNIIWIGIAMECVILLFQIVTLPVEFDASSRALTMIRDYGLADGEELEGCRTVLNAAALTYVAGVASSFLQILRLVLIYGGRRNRRD
ncbi:MAG: zinc metallopeptidase [Erysipelotrichaceae bacterium]|nr:zinc metallopeptidase [Erysipelotrichaceae bacterium]